MERDDVQWKEKEKEQREKEGRQADRGAEILRGREEIKKEGNRRLLGNEKKKQKLKKMKNSKKSQER